VFSFLGLLDLSFVRAEGIALGPDAVAAALQTAEAQLHAALRRAA
jgi:FMN-dependent NADH-azoreductase